MKKTVKSNVRKASRKQSSKIKTWQAVLAIVVIASVGILIVYRSFASTDFVYKKSYKNVDTKILQTKDVQQAMSTGGAKKVPVVQLKSNGKLPSPNNNAVNYHFTLPVGEYKLCQKGQVLSDTATLEIGLLANGADATAGTVSKTFNKNENIAELLCAEFSIPLDLPKNAGEVEYIVRVPQDPAKLEAISYINLSSFDIYVQNDINVGTGTRNNEQHVGHTCNGSRVIKGQITDQLGGPVPAQIGIDFHYPDNYTGSKEQDTSTGYERLVYLNITDPQEKNKNWCANIPAGVDSVSIESYSRTVYDHAKQLVNNALMFGNSQNHSVDMPSTGNKTQNIVLPNVCGTQGLPTSSTTGKVTMESVRVNGNLLDITPNANDPTKNAVWRSIAWSRNLDPGQTIAGYGALSVKQPNTPSANVIDRLAPRQKYLTKFFVVRGNHQYKFEVPGVYVTGCGDTRLRVAITDSQFGVYGSLVSGFANVYLPGGDPDNPQRIDFSSIVEEPAGTLNIQ